MNTNNNARKTSNTKYMAAILEAGNYANKPTIVPDTPFEGSACGPFSAYWGHVPSPSLAITASDIAMYAEHGIIEDNLSPRDYVESLILSMLGPGQDLGTLLLKVPCLSRLCSDALRRGSTDPALDDYERHNCGAMLESFAW